MWTAETSQQMCEVENVILSTPGYEQVCLNATVVPFLSSLSHPPGLELRTAGYCTKGTARLLTFGRRVHAGQLSKITSRSVPSISVQCQYSMYVSREHVVC